MVAIACREVRQRSALTENAIANDSTVRTTIIVAAITAIATVGGALGGTYLGSHTTLEAQREQLRHDDAQHQFDLKSNAYVEANQAISTYFAHVEDGSSSASTLTRDSFRAGDAADALDFLASKRAADLATDLLLTLNEAREAPAQDSERLIARAGDLYEQFRDAGRDDLSKVRIP